MHDPYLRSARPGRPYRPHGPILGMSETEDRDWLDLFNRRCTIAALAALAIIAGAIVLVAAARGWTWP